MTPLGFTIPAEQDPRKAYFGAVELSPGRFLALWVAHGHPLASKEEAEAYAAEKRPGEATAVRFRTPDGRVRWYIGGRAK